MARRAANKDKWKAKTWFEITSPKDFSEKIIGETPASEANNVIGRTIKVIASEVASGPRLNQVKLLFEIESVSGKIAQTKLAGYEMARSLIRSIVRRKRTKIELIKDYTTADNQKIRIKIVAMTVGNCYSSHEKDIRKNMEATLDTLVEGKKTVELIKEILAHTVQNTLKANARKIFPVAILEIRKVDFV